MSTAELVARVKNRSPRWAKDAANGLTRAYAVRTADRRHLPDFLIIGAKRAGTTSLWNYLLQSPLVMPMYPASRGIKSPGYFYVNHHRGDDWYRSHFATEQELDRLEAALGHRPVTGEACPYYMYYEPTVERVRALLPDVKIIVSLRDPVRRAYSHYWERVGAGTEHLGFEEALAAEPERLRGEREKMAADPGYYSRAHDFFTYRDRGIYAPQLEPWLEAFPRERFLIVAAEDMYRDEQAAMDRVTAFLGLPPHPLRVARRHNHLPAPPMNADTRDELVEFYRPHNRRLHTLLGTDFGWPA
ncbi:sulfotransferase [Thermomonospora umbrina]|uniref:Sulfotransferase family protein n=1 Tax=Thermomonospora umbrina TaxID=111806 RepID=A0A3D9SJU5_9ACTN|nr:sulfotransferase [Thermomonospora umbrina]REE96159.1 sulfotransferase family protein [Thermomonospora umbrina]